jgi:pimeloyl-ACP methyl ester carboxylesterase
VEAYENQDGESQETALAATSGLRDEDAGPAAWGCYPGISAFFTLGRDDVTEPASEGSPVMPSVRCGDVDIYYEDRGAGPAIVWIPGTGLRGSTWELQVRRFEDRFRCLTVDLRGSGDSSGADTAFTVADLAGDIAAWLDAIDVKAAVIAGLSLGSAVAQELALALPELVTGLVLLATWSSSAREHHIRRHFESRLYALRNGPLDVYGQFAFWMSSPSLFDHEPERQAEVERRLQAHMSGTPVGIAGHFLADLGHETRDRLGQVGCPCLVVHGDEDLITLPWYNRTVADLIPGATLASIPTAGHLAWLERPDEVNNLIERFLSRLPEPADRAL